MIVLKVSLVLVAGLAAAGAMRARPAASRHWLLAVCVICAALMPLFELVAPEWGFAVAPAGSWRSVAAEQDLLRLTWMAGSAIALASLIAGFIRLARVASRANRDIAPEWLAIVDAISRDLGLDRRVEILESASPLMPMTWGWLRPKVLLPSIARGWSADRLRAVVAHELAHVRRGDWAAQIVTELVACVYWFNPIVWIARRVLRLESDRACDDEVLGLGVAGEDYAAQLVAVARALRADRLAPAPTLLGARQLERRVTAALNVSVDRTPTSAVGAVAVLVAIVALTLPIAGFTLAPVVRLPRDAPAGTALSDVQRNIMLRFGGEERRLSLVSQDVSFWKNRIEGRVEVQARLGIDGSLSAVRIVEPVHPDLASAATAIVRQWRRDPALLRGVPVEVPIRMTVDFKR